MALEDYLTAKGIKALFNALEKSPVRIKGVWGEEREIVIWVSQPSKIGSQKPSSRTSK